MNHVAAVVDDRIAFDHFGNISEGKFLLPSENKVVFDAFANEVVAAFKVSRIDFGKLAPFDEVFVEILADGRFVVSTVGVVRVKYDFRKFLLDQWLQLMIMIGLNSVDKISLEDDLSALRSHELQEIVYTDACVC